MTNFSQADDIDLLGLLLEEEGIELEIKEVVPRVGSTEAPTSFQQRRLWFLYELEPTSSAYNICSIFDLKGTLNITALRVAFKQLQQRHESLRTTFMDVDGEPWQKIHANSATELRLEDWSNDRSEDKIPEIIAEIARHESDHQFNLQTGPLIRAQLFKIESKQHILSINLHHIIADAWSVGIILEEIAMLYQAEISKTPMALPELKFQYTDYALWQKGNFQNSNILEKSLTYWEKQLAQLPTLQFPLDFPRPRLQTFRGGLIKFEISKETTNRIRNFIVKEGATLFMFLMAVFQTLLSRYTGQEDIAVGTSIANRPSDSENLIGFFVNMLVIRTNLADEPNFNSLLKTVKKTILSAFEHKEIPFETLVEKLNLPRDTSRNPLFQIAFTLLNAPKPQFGTGDLEVCILATQEAARFDLELFITETEDTLNGAVSYNIDLLKRETVERLARHFCQLLESVLAQPEIPVSRLPFLLSEEIAVLAPSQPAQTFSVHFCLHDIFTEQAKLRPQQTALIFGQERLTYSEVNYRANQLAHYLMRVGVKPEARVGLWLSRSLDLVIGIIAILKAGGVYVPFDPNYPRDRITYMLEDSQIRVLLTHSEFEAQIPFEFTNNTNNVSNTNNNILTIFIDKYKSEFTQVVTTEPEVLILPDNAAYIIYTSGSTGKPKGVVVTHRHVVRLMLSTEKWFKFNAKDVWTLFHSCAFDFSVWEIWGALFYGGVLVIVPYLISRSPEEFYNLLCEEKVTVLNQTPSAFQQLIQAESTLCREGELELRYVIFGGEALDLASLEPWFERHDDQFPLLVNMYGITETTVHVTYLPVTFKDVKKGSGSLIGKQIPDLSLYILDRHLQPVPIGVVGEMYVGGAGVTRGYFHRPQLTAERMIPNPFATNDLTSARLYKTGDLARFLDNGNIEYIGRNDHQVKIRGFRIELGEIEAVIKSHPEVRDALVIAREESKEDVRLDAYIIPINQIANTETLTQEQTQEWQYTFNDTYNITSGEPEEDFNIIGWNSSYSNQPIPAVEMRQWLNNTLLRIRSLKPRKVLEIGCGTGMILLNIAPEVQSYWGTDFSQAAINRLATVVENRSLKNVNLLTREAIDFSEIPTGYFDTVVINSVAQYFPSIEYLQQVIKSVWQLLKTGGSLFIGDNRNLSLSNYFYASVAYFQANDNTDCETFKTQVRRIAKKENELILAPHFFTDLRKSFPDLTAVEIQIKSENNENELTKYRYDVILHKLGISTEQPPEIIWRDWETDNLQLTDLKQQVIEMRSIGWHSIPNGRLSKDAAIYQWMLKNSHENEQKTIGELRTVLNNIHEPKGFNPADFYAIAEEIGLEVSISYSPGKVDCFDVCFYPAGSGKSMAPSMPIVNDLLGRDNHPSWIDPLKNRLTKLLISQLKQRLEEKLPEYMCPSAFMILENFPLTPSGKLDRRALPIPDRDLIINQQSLVPPKTPTEYKLSQLWMDVLGIDKIGVTEDFFHLGGHSLLATKLVSRIREEFNVALPLRSIFEYSTIARLGDEIDCLIDVNTTKTGPEDIIPVSNRENLPLSFSQSRLWFLDLLGKENAAYNISVAFRLEGDLNVDALQESWQNIIQRHEVLRTTFDNVQGSPIQIVHDWSELKLTIRNLSCLDFQTQQETLRKSIQEVVITPFNLNQLPLLRIHLYQLSADVSVLLLVIHHIIADGWSLGVMVKELSLFYTAICQRNIPSIPPLSIQYGDFANWQREVFQKTQLPIQLAYWKQKLTGANQILELPTDYPRSPIPSYQGSAVNFAINPQTTQEFKKLCESQGATLFMGLLAVFSILLMRYSGQEDLLIGTPIANRNRKQTEDLIGFFVNTLVIRNNLSGNPNFINLLSITKEETLQAYAHQDVPFEKIVEEINPQRNLSQHPLFQVMFVWQNAPMNKLELPNLQLSPWRLEQRLAKFDLTLLMTETEQGIDGTWEYRTDLFAPETINRMIGHFETLLKGIIAEPQKPITHLPILTSHEKNQLLFQWNQTQFEYPLYQQNKCLHQLFELQVEKTPNNVAVVFKNQSLTYFQLNQRANQLAHYLQSRGVRPDVLVGICMERSLEMVIGLLGILKAGGAYVPMDSNYPRERLDFMLVDAGISLLLTQENQVTTLDILPPHQIICLDKEWQVIAQEDTHNPSTNLVVENLAYLIYTSGSTGQPKGVMISHSAICNHMLWMQKTFSFGEREKVLQKTPFSFDASVWEFYAPLLTGGQLIIAEKDGHKDVSYLLKLICEQQVTVLQMVPSLLQMFLEYGEIENCHSLTHIFCGGEALPVAMVENLLSKLNVNFHNLYGPTEACIDATFLSFTKENNHYIKQNMLPIGRPIANTQTYVLDAHLQPVPIGVPGELYIGGMGLARGYCQLPQLTRDKFIAHPFSDNPDSRLYKTGDLVRYLPDGNIEFIGRIDHQVKIRGFRIELGEIEAVLTQHPNVLNAVVVISGDSSATNSLIAYYVSTEKQFTSSGVLRDFLKEKLPDYMIPNSFIVLDHLPMTPNGKIDRKLLAGLNINRTFDAHQHVSPRTLLEYKLVEIWEEILQVSPISVTENFFDLGGHSLLAIRLIAAIEQKLKCNLPVVSLFREGTIEKIALLLDQDHQKASNHSDILIPLQTQGDLLPLFLVHQAGGYGLSYSVLAEKLAVGMGKKLPIYAIQSPGLDGKQSPLESIEEMANTYINTIREIQPHGPYLLGGHSLGGLIAFAMASQLEAMGEQIERVLIIDTHPPMPTDETIASLEDNAGIICFMVEQIALHFNKSVTIDYQTLSSLDQDSQLDYVARTLQTHNLIPPNSGNSLIARLIKVYKANLRASVVYQPPVNRSNITLFITPSLAAKFPNDPTVGWQKLTTQKVQVCRVMGEHQTMLKEPEVENLVTEIMATLVNTP
ncbi:non-ribosomal peptide synthetase [Cylindrospermopsis raciborskii S07]|uniref:amino acid adenylation domain-containing protein n=2 Tax=Cylindrospermopsis raciborskii TaxID=77022 RepID=UPI000C9DE4A9|nr:non-ribosomal peptide synthetase [Cylindrospermopsis raciborskii]PNK02252.1 non-ribosomal peptide synthetase [Cylindrospermopsis raciborskii S10]PNK10929.1 non-ribosomal peptide synthetase [Cylindrospermopsis raciborskii S07]PNK13665.1 non-ribosomal peptide synthetase [Cylindrospermopsis raciborskii S05]PNK14584.1 non-ribosomal peptide synthetase [Cylindrospermopsis raciborskii S06]